MRRNPPRGSIEADDTGTDAREVHRPCQQDFCKGCIMGVSRREQKEERQARTATDERVHTKASRSVNEDGEREHAAISRIGIMASAGQDGSTLNEEITSADESSSESLQNDQDKK